MKQSRILLALTVLLLASLACQALMGGGDEAQNAPGGSVQPGGDSVEATAAPADPGDDGGAEAVVSTDFPMTADAYNVVDIGDGSLLYYTKMPQEEVLKFYRDEYAARGYTEREILTTVSDGVFSIVFDGDPSGKAVVIQSVDLGDGSSTVAIRLEDV